MSKYFSIFKILPLLLLLLTGFLVQSTPVHAANDLGQIFNFFDVNCLVPDSNDSVAPGGRFTNFTKSNTQTNTLPFAVKECAKGGASLIDQAVGFLYQLGPILAVVVVMWGGFLYYNSALDGDNARAMKTVQAGVTGLAIILGVPILYGIFQGLSDSGGPGSSADLFTRLTNTLVNQLIRPVANTLLVLGGAFAVLSFIYAGYQYLLGDAKKGEVALRNAFTGLIVVLASVAIVALIQVTYGFIFPSGT